MAIKKYADTEQQIVIRKAAKALNIKSKAQMLALNATLVRDEKNKTNELQSVRFNQYAAWMTLVKNKGVDLAKIEKEATEVMSNYLTAKFGKKPEKKTLANYAGRLVTIASITAVKDADTDMFIDCAFYYKNYFDEVFPLNKSAMTCDVALNRVATIVKRAAFSTNKKILIGEDAVLRKHMPELMNRIRADIDERAEPAEFDAYGVNIAIYNKINDVVADMPKQVQVEYRKILKMLNACDPYVEPKAAE